MNSKPKEKMFLDFGTWEQTLQELMQEVKPRDRWCLKLDETLKPDSVAQGWKQYQQKAFGRFRCSSCKRSWASAKVQILCHMYLERRKSQGQVLMRLFAQRCKKCSKSHFEKPEFSLDSAMRILNNLVRRIQERCYENGIRKFAEIPVIPEVPLEGSHDTANCEACILGFCAQSLQNCTTPFKSPFSYMEFRSSLPHSGDMCSQNQAMNQPAKAEKAQRRGNSCEHKRSGPSHATAGTQLPRTGPRPKQETGQQPTPGADQQAARRTKPQPTQVTKSHPPGCTNRQPTQAVGSLPSPSTNSLSALGTGPQTPQKTYSQAVRCASQQSKQEILSQAKQEAGLQATKGTDPQPTRRAGPTTTRGSDTCNEIHALLRRQERCSPRGPPPDGFSRSSMPPNNFHGPDNLFMWGFVCVAALWAFIIRRYL
ncbi:receptor-transporting protein 4 [Molossus nigricans]